MSLILKSIVGGLFIGFILWLSKTKFSALAGLLLFFPIISVPTFFFLGSSGNMAQLREAILWSFWSIPVWALFALTLYLCSFKFNISASIALSLAAWFAAAGILIYIRSALGQPLRGPF